MPTAKPAAAKSKRIPKKAYDPPLAGDGSPTYGELRHQLESLFRGFHSAQGTIVVCRMALERVGTPEDRDISNVLGSIVFVRIDYHLRKLARLTKSVGGVTAYDDDEEDIDYETYGEVAIGGALNERHTKNSIARRKWATHGDA